MLVIRLRHRAGRYRRRITQRKRWNHREHRRCQNQLTLHGSLRVRAHPPGRAALSLGSERNRNIMAAHSTTVNENPPDGQTPSGTIIPDMGTPLVKPLVSFVLATFNR